MSLPQHPLPQAHFLLSSPKTIIVSGAGIAGLTFAVALSHHCAEASVKKPKVIIYERDSRENRVGREGYSLSLRADGPDGGGVGVLDRLGLYDRVRRVSVNADDDVARRGQFHVWDRDFDHPLLNFFATAAQSHKPILADNMRIRRNALQRLLADAAVETGAEIHWDAGVTDARRGPDDKMLVSVSDNSEGQVCDLLVAADGSRSRLRSALLHKEPDLVRLDYTGYYMCSGTAGFKTREEIPPPLDRHWGVVIGVGGTGLFVSPVDDKSVLWGLSRRNRDPQPTLRPPLDPKNLKLLVQTSLDLAQGFPPVVSDLISRTDPNTLIQFNAMDRPAFANIPLRHGPVVWIGDATHAVSPFAGYGANLALMDAWDLAAALTQPASPSLAEAVARYDQVAIPRAGRVLKMSHWNIALMHAAGWRLLLWRIWLKVFNLLGPFLMRFA